MIMRPSNWIHLIHQAARLTYIPVTLLEYLSTQLSIESVLSSTFPRSLRGELM